jgi:methyl-accepting chemotaxis protein
MQWIRNISLVKRVIYGFAGLGTMFVGMGGSTAWLLSQQAATTSVAWAVGAATVAGAGLSLVASWLIVGSIKTSVEDTIQCVVRIAGGDLETKIESPGKDEVSWLRAELNGMRKKLRKAVLEVRETVGGVNSATAEIASGNLDLSNRTEQQASALQQTAASLQQLTGTVRSNAENASQARNVVAQSSAVASRGAQTMQDVVARMAEIHDASRRIGEIIGVIDGIAFQTNILALNAAVEAARAGEHGRGFAVVASEVRSLAQRSSVAAREIKELISDSGSKVEAGSALVGDAGRTMEDIVRTVSSVSALIDSIAQAGQSQSHDISQVSQAVEHIDSMTQQNAALVEELAAAAQSMKGQSERLSGSISSFHVVPG